MTLRAPSLDSPICAGLDHGESWRCSRDRFTRRSRARVVARFDGRDDQPVIELVVREFGVDVPLQDAWDHLAQVERWTSWAKHIKRVSLEPPGALTGASAGAFRLAGGARSTFRM